MRLLIDTEPNTEGKPRRKYCKDDCAKLGDKALAGCNVIRELDTVVLTHDIDEYGLKQGDIGAVVHCYRDEMAFEVEFVTAEGRTIALLTLSQADIRPIVAEALHVRELAQVAA